MICQSDFVCQSLFAMPMFEWPHTPGQTVSGHFWVYWAVTLPLTLVVVGVWLGWTNREELQIGIQRASTRRRRGTTAKSEV